MSWYQVFYWIKKNNHCYLEHMFTAAKNQKEACRKVSNIVTERTGRHAFYVSCKAPDLDEYRNCPYYVVD